MMGLAQQDKITLPDFILKIHIDVNMLGISIGCQEGGGTGWAEDPDEKRQKFGGIPSSSSVSPPTFTGG